MGALGEELGFDLNTPWEKLPAKARRSPARRPPDQGPRRHHQPLRPPARLLRRVRGRPHLRRAPARRGRVRHQPRALRGLHARGAVPGLPGQPAQAGQPGGDDRRQVDRRGLRPADQRDRRLPARARPVRPREADRASGCSRRSRSGSTSCSTSASTTSPSTGPSGSLSGGEAQRIRLATQIGAGLVGVLYVLDEPSIGLHQRDNQRLIETLVRLKDLGNTLIVVEHDEETIRTADWVVDIGPGAGEHGGQVVHSGPVKGLLKHRDSLTGLYLSGRREIPVPEVRRPRTKGRELKVVGANEHNLQDIDVIVPAGAVRLGDRRVRVRQVHAGQRHPLHQPGQADLQRPRGAGPAQADQRARPRRQGDPRRPVADRPHAAQQPGDVHRGLRPHPQALRLDARGEDAGLPPGPLLVQRQGRPLRGVLRRRHDQDRDELPARRLRPVRGLPRRPLQPRDARGPLQGQDHRRGPRHADRGGRRVLRGGAARSRAT